MGPFIFLDIETTGFDPSRNHIIEIACLKWNDFKVLEKLESLINPKIPIPAEISLLTGITDESVKNAPIFSQFKQSVIDLMGDYPVIGHNIPFDMGFLKHQHFAFKNAEIDTVSLARILLPKESSYALEVLAKKYGIPLRVSHRAMDDVNTTKDFFEFLSARISQLDEKDWDLIDGILEKSDWPGKSVFKKVAGGQIKNDSSNVRGKIDLSGAREPKTADEGIVSSAAAFAIPPGNKVLFESSKNIPLDIIKNERTIISYATNRKRDEILRQARTANIPAVMIKDRAFYLSPEKFSQKLDEEKIQTAQTPFLLKIALWSNETKTGDREELTLERNEFSLFDEISDAHGEDILWSKNLAEASKANIVLVHHAALANISDDIKKDRNLIISEAAKLEDSLTNACRKKYTEIRLRPYFGEKASMVFGLLGIFYDRYCASDSMGYKGNVIIDETARNSVEWRRFIESAKNLPEHAKKEEFLRDLEPNKNVIQWVTFFADEVIFLSAPVNLTEIFGQATAGYAKILIQSSALCANDDFALIRELFSLDSEWLAVCSPKNLIEGNVSLEIPADFPEPNTEGYFLRCNELFLKIIEERRGNALFLLHSKKAVDAVYQAILPKVKKIGINLLAVGPSGGMGKALSLFAHNPAQSVLVCTSQIIPYLEEIEAEISVIVFQKIPFDAPSDPLIAARAAQFKDGFNEYSLPRAMLKFREILDEFGGSGAQKKCYILDSRILKRSYGKLFLQNQMGVPKKAVAAKLPGF